MSVDGGDLMKRGLLIICWAVVVLFILFLFGCYVPSSLDPMSRLYKKQLEETNKSKEKAKVEKLGKEVTKEEAMMERDNSPQRPCQLGTVHVEFEREDLHKGPGLIEEVVGRVSRATDLKAIMETDFWLLVEDPSGKRGWIAKDWVLEDIKQQPEQ